MGKGYVSEKGDYSWLKLTNQIRKVVEGVIESLIRQQVHINEMNFGFTSGCGATDCISFLRQLQYQRLCKKKYFYLAFWDCLVGFKEYRDTSVTGYVCAVNV